VTQVGPTTRLQPPPASGGKPPLPPGSHPDISRIKTLGNISAAESIRLNVGGPDHLAPLFGFVGMIVRRKQSAVRSRLPRDPEGRGDDKASAAHRSLRLWLDMV
jgi:hypothetical protein